MSALYGTQLVNHATDDRGLKAPLLEEFENEISTE